MFGIADLVVVLWALPVTLFIITPLVIMVVWLLARLANSIINVQALRDKMGEMFLGRNQPLKLSKLTSKPKKESIQTAG